MKYKKTNILRLANTVLQKVKKERLFNSQHNLLITFSGGQDSVFCLLVLFLLQTKTKLTWNRQKLLDLSRQYQTKQNLRKQSLIPITLFDLSCHKKRANAIKPILHRYALRKRFILVTKLNVGFVSQVKQKNLLLFKIGVTKTFLQKTIQLVPPAFSSFVSNPNTERLTLTAQSPFKTNRQVNNFFFEKEKIAYTDLSNSFVSNYTLLWCNHFWQNDSFFTMEHVCKHAFCQSYAIYVFATAKKVLSEQNARNWRHKVMQRSSLFLCQKEHCYKSFELCFNSISITKTLLFNSSLCVRNKTLLRTPNQINTKIAFLHNEGMISKTNKCVRAKTRFVQKQSLCKNKICARTHEKTKKHQNKVLVGMGYVQKRKLCVAKTKFLHALHAKLKQNEVLLRNPLCMQQPEQLCVQGHNKSDRAEAVLFNVIKGTGMNGMSTLQWKHTFLSALNSNDIFYPTYSDFFKEIRVICLNPIFIKSFGKNKVKSNKYCLSDSLFILAKQITKLMQKRSYAKTSLCKNVSFCTHCISFVTPYRQSSAFSARQGISFISTMKFWYNLVVPKEIVNSNKLKYKNLSKNSYVKNVKLFYYQLKYKNKNI